MRITFVSEYFPTSEAMDVHGGVEARCFLVARELARRHRVTVVTSRVRGSRTAEDMAGLRVIRCGRERAYSQAGSILGRLTFMTAAYREAARADADLIEGENYFSYLPAFLAARRKGLPPVALYADVLIGSWIDSFGPLWGAFWEVAERLLLRLRWHTLVAISETTRRKLLARGVPAGAVRVVPCPVEVDQAPEPDGKFERPTICCIARLVSYKRVDVLLRAMAEIRGHLPEVACKVVGTGPEEGRLRRLVRDLGLTGHVELLGHLPGRADVLRTLSRSHLFCLPSSVEGFGIVTIEAMASGVPYVSSAIPVTVEVTEGGSGGLLFAPGDHQDLARGALRLLTDRDLYLRKAAEGRALARRYALPEVVGRLERLYLELAPRP